jgi:hypothetical protein
MQQTPLPAMQTQQPLLWMLLVLWQGPQALCQRGGEQAGWQ